MTRFFLFTFLPAVPASVLSVASKIETCKAVTPLRVSRVCALLFGVFLAVAAMAAITGPHRIDLLSLLRQDGAAASPEHTIVFSVRIPRIILAATWAPPCPRWVPCSRGCCATPLAIVKITHAEPGGLDGKGIWRPAQLGFRPAYENEAMKLYLAGGFVKKNGRRG